MAIRWLARREWSRAELASRLRQRGVVSEEAERVLDQLSAAGYLSDARFAQALVAQKAGRYAKRAIAHALKERGIGSDDAAGALLQLEVADELADAEALWQRRFGECPANDREKARQVRFLMSRGYSVSVALRILRAAGARVGEDS